MFRTWWRRWRQRPARSASSVGSLRRRTLQPRVGVELLEDRLAPATHLWLGLANSLWSDNRNWQCMPAPCNPSPVGDVDAMGNPLADVVFPGGPANFTSTNDTGNIEVRSITFQTSNIVLTSLPNMTIRVRQGITDDVPSAGTNTINSPLVFTSPPGSPGTAHTILFNRIAARVLNLAGVVSGAAPGDSIVRAGTGELGLYAANTFQGGIRVQPHPTLASIFNILAIGHPDALGTGRLTLQGGTLRAAVDVTIPNDFVVTEDPLRAGDEGSSISSLDISTGRFTLNDLTLTGGGTLNADTSLAVDSYGVTRFTNTLSGPGNLIVDVEIDPRITTTAKVVLGGDNTYSGITFVLSGDLAATTDTAFGTSRLFFFGGQLQSDNSVQVITVANPFTVNDNATSVFGGIYSFILTGDGVLSLHSVLTLGNTAGTVTLRGQLSGPGSVVKTGAGTALLAGNNVHLGNTTIRGGVLSVSNNNSLGAGRLDLAGGTLGIAAPVTLPNTFAVVGDSTIAGNSNVIFQGPGAFTGNVTFTLTVANTATTTFTNVISGVGAIRIDVGAGGVVNFFGVSTYSGGTTLVTGTITVNSDRSLGVGTVTLNGGAIQANAAVTLPNTILVNGNTAITGTNNLVITGGVTLLSPANSFVIRNNAVTTFTNVINGSGQIGLNAPAGTLDLPAANTYTGGTTVTAGTLLGRNNLSFGTGVLNFNGGRLLPTQALTFANAWTVNGNPALDAAFNLTFTGFGNLIGGNLTVRNNAVVTFTHAAFLNITGAGSITKSDAGTLVLTSNGDYRGGVTLNAGLLRVGHPNALGAGLFTVNGGTLRADSPVTLPNAVNVNGSAAVDGTTNLTFGGAGTTALAAGTTLTISNAAVTTINQAVRGAGNLTVAAGTVVLTANNTYTGATAVNGGTLLVNGSQPSSPVTVTGANLGGTGTTGPVTLRGGTLKPGVGAGILRATGNVSLNSTSVLQLELNSAAPGTGFDQYLVAGVLDLNSDGGAGGRIELLPGFTPAVGASFTVLTTTGGVRGTFSAQPENSAVLVGDLTFRITYRGGANQTDIVLTRVLTNSTTTLTAAPNPSNPGQAVTFTATVRAFSGGALGDPTGTVTFFEGQSQLGVVPLVGGVALFVTSFFTVGNYAISAGYSGDGNFTPSGPAQLTLAVRPDLGVPVNQRYVAQLYRDLLGREADPAGLNTFTQLLDQNQLTRVGAVQAIQASREYLERVVRDAYRTILNREVDAVGLAGWTDFLSKGNTPDRMRVLLLDSQEFFQRRGGGTANGFLQAVYLTVLGRPIESVGQQLWGARLTAGSPRGAVAEEVLRSDESNRRRVDNLFRQLLRRPADANGLNGFVAAMAQGVTLELVAVTIMASEEYYLRA